MIPQIGNDIDFKKRNIPTRTYKANDQTERIVGYVDELEAMKQAILFRLGVERRDHEIHSDQYGVELKELIGKPIPYVLPEIKRLVTEALLRDDRITGVDDFAFETLRSKVVASFVVTTIFGELQQGLEVAV